MGIVVAFRIAERAFASRLTTGTTSMGRITPILVGTIMDGQMVDMVAVTMVMVVETTAITKALFD
jgi:hypothetical protein